MLLERFALKDRVAIVTGAGRGIGKGIALAFADVGAHVAVAARTESEIQNTAAEIQALGRKTLVIPTDVRSGEQMENMVQRTLSEFGHIDILVNNAGGIPPGSPDKWNEESWDNVVDLNLKSQFLGCKAVVPVMTRQQSGCIINMGSLTSRAAFRNSAAYGAAKAAIINFTQTLAAELGSDGIRVNAICPGKTVTSATELLWSTPELQAQGARDVFLKRLGTPEDVALLAIFLASDAASWITGETYNITGGWGEFHLM